MTTYLRPYNIKQSDLTPEWHVIDAKGRTLGRLGSEIAVLLMGKHKPSYVPHLVAGDFVVVVNADKFKVTGNKLAAKKYYRHSGYHGGLTEETLAEVLAKDPTRALKKAVKGMLPKNIQGKRMLSRLKLYVGEEHPHEAQVNAPKPEAPTFGVPKAGTEKAVTVAKPPKPKAAAEPEVESSAPAEKAEAMQDNSEAAEAVPADDLADMTVAQLRELAESRGVVVASRARKADIIKLLTSA